MGRYDFSDHQIMTMVMTTHIPEERSINGSLQPVTCAKDGEPWPCQARQELKFWDAERIAAAQMMSPPPLRQEPGGERIVRHPDGYMPKG